MSKHLEHLEQIRHNKKFLVFLDKHSDQQFIDWQMTVVFYTALHFIHALARKKKCNIGASHEKVHENINPDNKSAIMPLPELEYASYVNLYHHSRNARYKCWAMDSNNPLLQYALSECKTYLFGIEEYCIKEGVKV